MPADDADTSASLVQTLRTALPYITVVVVISAVVRAVTALPVRNPAAHLSAGEAWLWVAVFAAVMLVQSAALSLQAGVEVAYVGVEQPDQAPARPSS